MLEPPALAGADVESAMLRLIGYAAALPASDMFLAPGKYDGTVSVRHMGVVRTVMSLPREDLIRYVNHFKAVAGMPVDQRLRPLDGRWVCAVNGSRRVELRLATIPTLWGEAMAMRLLEQDVTLLELGGLGFHAAHLEDLTAMLGRPSGLILVTGPAGSGKTTTLYACLSHLNDGTRKINTIEDPIELVLPGVHQSEVQPKIDLGFPELLRAVLRQAPDVIMLGEIRDPVTAETAALAANSGHLVFATLHAPTAAAAPASMMALGANPHFLAASLLGVLSQRLVRRLCPHCRQAFDVSESVHTFEDIRRWLEPGEGTRIYGAAGCERCHHEGYSGRTGVAEVLRVSRSIREMIDSRRTADEIRQAATEQGMLDLRRSALLSVARGITSTEEVIRRISAEHLMPSD
ncbi:MAG: type II/IV secretion system protein [Planctomycetes bacterium]|nr:type II/IV secretion system protein [Planctomycetota bacterium]